MTTRIGIDVDKLEAPVEQQAEIDTLKLAIGDLTRANQDLRREVDHINHLRFDCTRALRAAQQYPTDDHLRRQITFLRAEIDRLKAQRRKLNKSIENQRHTIWQKDQKIEKKAQQIRVQHAALIARPDPRQVMNRMRSTLAAIETAALAAAHARRMPCVPEC